MNEGDAGLREALGGDAPAARAAAAFAERADALGLAEVAYGTVDSPLGRLLVAATGRGVVRVAFADAGEEPALEELAARVSPRVLRLPRRVDPARRQLDEYFGGRRRAFDLPLDRRLVAPGFRGRVLEVTAAIPYGAVSTYGEVAEAAGAPRAARAAGSALAANPLPLLIPCHRVVRAGGVLGHYGGGPERKRALIGLESGGG